MRTWLRRVRSLLGRAQREPERRFAFRPECELLEDRRLMTLAAIYSNMFSDHLRGAASAPPQVAGLLSLQGGDGRFTDLDYSGTSDASAGQYRVHAQRLKTLAQAFQWNDTGNPWYQSATLQDAAVRGWGYLAYTAPGVDRVPTWFHRQIALPNDLNGGLVLWRDQTPAATLTAVLDKYYARQFVWLFPPADGANLTWRATAGLTEGVLRGSTARANDVRARVVTELFAFTGDGIMQDLSFRQHNLLISSQWYSGGYGVSFTGSMTELLRWTRGSDFAFNPEAVDHFLSYVLDHLQWLTRRDGFELTSQGREISRPGIALGQARRLRNFAQELQVLGNRTKDLQLLMDRYDRGPTDDNYLFGNQAYYKTDGLIHQRRGWTAGLRLLSNRTLRPETLNNENTRAFFAADGFTTLFQDGDEFGTAAGTQQVFPVWDWKKLPGTTVEQSPGLPPVVSHDIFNLPRLTGQTRFVGSASDGAYGLAAMDYRRATVNVSARKAWFFLDDELVALGAGVNAPAADSSIATTLNQAVLDGTVTVRRADDTEQTFGLGTTVQLVDPRWVHHDGRGYVFLGSAGDVTVQTQTRAGNWSDIGTYGGAVSLPIFTTWVDHGIRPKDAGYAYAIVANATPQSLAAYHANQPVTVLHNTADLQAVRHEGLGQTQAAFYTPGWLQANKWLWAGVHTPILFLLQETGDGLQLTVADPTHSLREAHLDLTAALTGDGAEWLPNEGVTRITIPLPSGGYAGASVTRTFSYLGDAPGSRPDPRLRGLADVAVLLAKVTREPLGQIGVPQMEERASLGLQDMERDRTIGIDRADDTSRDVGLSDPRRSSSARDQVFADAWSANVDNLNRAHCQAGTASVIMPTWNLELL